MKDHNYYIYILTNWTGDVMYVGVTNDLQTRLWQHKSKTTMGFTKSYAVEKLVYFERTSDVNVAIAREKEIKGWRREKKNKLVISTNPEWKDLSDGWFDNFSGLPPKDIL